jgi:hypothetical protein
MSEKPSDLVRSLRTEAAHPPHVMFGTEIVNVLLVALLFEATAAAGVDDDEEAGDDVASFFGASATPHPTSAIKPSENNFSFMILLEKTC